MSEHKLVSPKIIATISVADRRYELIESSCSQCKTTHYSVQRWTGALFSHYFLPLEFKTDQFDEFVKFIDNDELFQRKTLIDNLLKRVHESNNSLGIHAEFNLAFRVVEHGRQAVVLLHRLGLSDALSSDSSTSDPTTTAIRAAFDLGVAATEHKYLSVYEPYIWGGIDAERWREKGHPLARAERIRQGRKSRTIIKKAATEIYNIEPELRRNDAETARRIEAQKLDGLKKPSGGYLGQEAIVKHLRALRPQLSGKS